MNNLSLTYKRPLIFIVLLYIVLIAFNYANHNQFNWFENLIKTLFIVGFFEIMMWLFSSKKQPLENKRLFFINHQVFPVHPSSSYIHVPRYQASCPAKPIKLPLTPNLIIFLAANSYSLLVILAIIEPIKPTDRNSL